MGSEEQRLWLGNVTEPIDPRFEVVITLVAGDDVVEVPDNGRRIIDLPLPRSDRDPALVPTLRHAAKAVQAALDAEASVLLRSAPGDGWAQFVTALVMRENGFDARQAAEHVWSDGSGPFPGGYLIDILTSWPHEPAGSRFLDPEQEVA